jgi:hypothetical protein
MEKEKNNEDVKNAFKKFGVYKYRRNQKAQPNGCVCHERSQNLTKVEAEIYTYLCEEGLTVSQVAARRGCSKQYVRKVRSKLKNKGFFLKVAQMVAPQGGDSATSATKKVVTIKRLHAQKFRVELIYPVSDKYVNSYVGSVFWLDGNAVQCYRDVVLVQSRKDFVADSEQKAIELSMVYWERFLRKLESRLGVHILKEGKHNITCTYEEDATGPCDLSRECEKRGKRIEIYWSDAKGGKLRYSTDKSLAYEREGHGLTGRKDSEVGNRFIEDVLDHPEAPVYSQLVRLSAINQHQLGEVASGLAAIVRLFEASVGRSNRGSKESGVRKRPEYVG